MARLTLVVLIWGSLLSGDLWAGEEPEPRRVKVAAISFVPKKFDLAGNAQLLAQAFRDAARAGAELAVAPEGVLEGYVVNEIIAGKVPANRMRDVAIAIDDPVIERFRKLAGELQMCLVFGFAEQVGNDVFNSAVFIDHTGKICGKYHKMQLAEGYSPTWWFNRLGATSRAFDTPFGRCGVLICNDRWNADLARLPVLDGAQFLVIPSYGSRSKEQDEAVLSRAREHNVPIVEANVGVSLIVSGNQIAKVDRQEVGITIGEILVPAARPPDRIAREVAEQQFLRWRSTEMDLRYAKRAKHAQPAK